MCPSERSAYVYKAYKLRGHLGLVISISRVSITREVWRLEHISIFLLIVIVDLTPLYLGIVDYPFRDQILTQPVSQTLLHDGDTQNYLFYQSKAVYCQWLVMCADLHAALLAGL